MQRLTSITGAGSTDVQVAEEARWHKSAGLAWLLSLFVPGAGHLYAGLYLRGVLVLGTSILGLLLVISLAGPASRGMGSIVGAAIVVMPILWVFGFVDAYFSTVERNRGIQPEMVDNPRVAVVLNLVTNGFGYFYLGERTKGIAVFVAAGLARFLEGALSGRVQAALWALLAIVSVYISIDAYRIGRRAFAAQVASMELPPAPPPSRVPPIVPVIFAAASPVMLVLVLALGSLAVLLGGQRPPSAGQGPAPVKAEVSPPQREEQGVTQGYAEAAMWCRTAADQGDASAQHRLGAMYEYGTGVQTSDAEAVNWYRKAADQGYPPALYDLGCMYASGKGVARDAAEAYKWWYLAAFRAEGDLQKKCAESRDGIGKALTVAQATDAKKRAREWMKAFEKRKK